MHLAVKNKYAWLSEGLINYRDLEQLRKLLQTRPKEFWLSGARVKMQPDVRFNRYKNIKLEFKGYDGEKQERRSFSTTN